MALEDLTGPDKFIDALVETNPEASDGLNAQDDHSRGIKNVLNNTLPNFTGQVVRTHEDVNNIWYSSSVGGGDIRAGDLEKAEALQERWTQPDGAAFARPLGFGDYRFVNLVNGQTLTLDTDNQEDCIVRQNVATSTIEVPGTGTDFGVNKTVGLLCQSGVMTVTRTLGAALIRMDGTAVDGDATLSAGDFAALVRLDETTWFLIGAFD